METLWVCGGSVVWLVAVGKCEGIGFDHSFFNLQMSVCFWITTTWLFFLSLTGVWPGTHRRCGIWWQWPRSKVLYWWMQEMYCWCNFVKILNADGVKGWSSALCKGWNLAGFVCWEHFFEDLQSIKSSEIVLWIILPTVECCLCALWQVRSREPTLQISWWQH